jgi:SAM-dependent methyltransferase
MEWSAERSVVVFDRFTNWIDRCEGIKLKSNWSFDADLYQQLNTAREQVLRPVLAELKDKLTLKTSVDVGCGVGHFSNLLHSLGFEVLGVDAREENVVEARQRYPHLEFRVMNAEDPGMEKLGPFDIGLCLGLLYHLENPFRAIRALGTITSRIAFVEGVCYPSDEPVMALLNENKLGDQGVNYLAFYPSEASLLKMLYNSTFTDCFHPQPMPAHPFYQLNKNGFRYRTMMVASKMPLTSGLLEPVREPETELTPWNMKPLRALGLRADRLAGRFLKTVKPSVKK